MALIITKEKMREAGFETETEITIGSIILLRKSIKREERQESIKNKMLFHIFRLPVYSTIILRISVFPESNATRNRYRPFVSGKYKGLSPSLIAHWPTNRPD